jgi:Tfp pilus assembly protein PilW
LTNDDHIPGRRDLRSAGGYTLTELLVALLLFLSVMAIVVPIMITTIRAEPRISGKANDIQRARTTVERMIRDLRSGFAVNVAASTQLALRTYTRRATCGEPGILPSNAPATPCRVTYTCAAGTCERAEQPITGSGGSSEIVVQGLASNDVFAYTPSTGSPGYVGIRLEFPNGEGDDDTITLVDGVDLRNVAAGA